MPERAPRSLRDQEVESIGGGEGLAPFRGEIATERRVYVVERTQRSASFQALRSEAAVADSDGSPWWAARSSGRFLRADRDAAATLNGGTCGCR